MILSLHQEMIASSLGLKSIIKSVTGHIILFSKEAILFLQYLMLQFILLLKTFFPLPLN